MSLEKADQIWLTHLIMKKLEIFRKGKIHLISLDFK